MKKIKTTYISQNLRKEESEAMCPLHGPFLQTRFYLGDLLKQSEDCPVCRRQAWLEEQAAIEEAELAEKEFLRRKLILSTGMPEEYLSKSFDSFNPQTESQKEALALSQKFVLGWKKASAGGFGLLFYGACGTGKTHLACAILSRLAEDVTNAKYAKAGDIFTAVRRSYSPKSEVSEEEVLGRFVRAGLLVIDEIGVQKGSDAERRVLFQILDARINAHKPSILLTNLKKSDLQGLLGERLFDRVRNKCVPQLFTGESMRKPATAEVFE